MADKRCLFYGRAYFSATNPGPNPPFILFPQHGNQCALITESHSPCRMEMAAEEPDQDTCPLVKMVRCEEVV